MKRLLLTAALWACAYTLFAQKEHTDSSGSARVTELEEVEVSSSSNRKLLYQPAAITKLAPRELQRSTGLFLDDAINANVPGVQMQRRAVSSGQQINIRGYGNGVRGNNGTNSNFDIQGTKVYINGIPITDAEGITVLDDIDFASLGSVEITKGPAGTLYGQAIAGAVHLRTQKAEPGKTSVSQQVLIGNYGLERYTTGFRFGGERSSVLLNYGHQESNGAAAHNHSRKDFVNFSGEFNPNAKQVIHSYFGYANSYDQRYGELDTAQWRNEDYSGNPNYIKNDAHSHFVSMRAGLGHTYAFSDRMSNTTSVFGYGAMTDASSAGGWTDKNPVNFGARSAFNTRFSFGSNILSGVTGFELLGQRAQTIGYAMGTDTRNPSGYNRITSTRSNVATATATNSVFTEWTLTLPGDIAFTGGIGWSGVKLKLNDRLIGVNSATASANTPDIFRRNYDDMWAPHLAVNKVFGGKVSAYASWSRGFKAPVTSYFYIPFVAGAPGTGKINANLVPERGDQFEIGSKGTFLGSRVNYELALFHTTFENKMTAIAVPLDATTTAYTYVTNGGRQVHDGVELSLRGAAFQSEKGFIRQLSPFVNATYIQGKYEDYRFMRFRVAPNQTKDSTVDFSGKKVAGLPPLVFNAGFDLVTGPGLYFNAYYAYRDDVYITGDNRVRVDGFGLVNAKVGFRRSLGTHFDIDASAGAINLGDVQYYQMVFINQLPDAYVAAPRHTQWFGGITLKYNF
jgi:iron complex outermembrane recepter protein